MLFTQLEYINTKSNKESIKTYEKVSPLVKLQCIICTDLFDINTEHNCLMRNYNQEFTINTRYARI